MNLRQWHVFLRRVPLAHVHLETLRRSERFAAEIADGSGQLVLRRKRLPISVDPCHVHDQSSPAPEDFVAQCAGEVGLVHPDHEAVDFLLVLVDHLHVLPAQITELKEEEKN